VRDPLIHAKKKTNMCWASCKRSTTSPCTDEQIYCLLVVIIPHQRKTCTAMKNSMPVGHTNISTAYVWWAALNRCHATPTQNNDG
jgi:hypothetical protein